MSHPPIFPKIAQQASIRLKRLVQATAQATQLTIAGFSVVEMILLYQSNPTALAGVGAVLAALFTTLQGEVLGGFLTQLASPEGDKMDDSQVRLELEQIVLQMGLPQGLKSKAFYEIMSALREQQSKDHQQLIAIVNVLRETILETQVDIQAQLQTLHHAIQHLSQPGIVIHGGIHNYYGQLPPLTNEERLRLRSQYLERVITQTQTVNLRGIPLLRNRNGSLRQPPIPLDKIYIRVQAISKSEKEKQERQEEKSLQTHSDRGHARLADSLYRRGQSDQATAVDPIAAFAEHKRLVVLGPAGAGKTTLLAYLARQKARIAQNNPEELLPIQVSLRDYALKLGQEVDTSLPLFAIRQASGGNSKMEQMLTEAVDEDRVIWLADALDEAHHWANDVAERVGQLSGNLLLTSRPNNYSSPAGLVNTPHFVLLPLEITQVEQFLRNWFTAYFLNDEKEVAKRVEALQQQWQQNKSLQSLLGNPLLLTFLAVLAVEQDGVELPNSRAELYKRYVKELVIRWETGDPRQQQVGKQQISQKKRFTLAGRKGSDAQQLALDGFYKLGWLLHVGYYGGRTSYKPTQIDLPHTLSQELKITELEADEVLLFWEQAGLIDFWTLDGKEYLAFRHLTFQEYAVSLVLGNAWQDDQNQTWKFLKPRLHHYAWREPILLMANQLTQEANKDLLALIRGANSMSENYVHRDLRLVVSIIANDDRLFTEFAEAIAKELTSMLRNAIANREEKDWFIRSFGELGDQIVPYLENLIEEQNQFAEEWGKWLAVEVIYRFPPQAVNNNKVRELGADDMEEKRKLVQRFFNNLNSNDIQTAMGREDYTVIESWPDEITTNDASLLCEEKRKIEQDWFNPSSKDNAFDYLTLVVNRLDELALAVHREI